jgi:hypothetical protein
MVPLSPTHLALALSRCQLHLHAIAAEAALTRISTPSASLSELIRSKGVFPPAYQPEWTTSANWNRDMQTVVPIYGRETHRSVQ